MFAYFHYKPELPPDNPSVSSQDVTVIIPTLAVDLKQLMETVESACKLEPSEIILVATESCLKRVSSMVKEMGMPKKIKVLSIGQANKRRQMSRAIPEVRTEITLLLDDDVWLPGKFMKWVLAPFEDPFCGGVGTNQTRRREDPSNIFEFLGVVYLIRRNFDCTACNWLDGGLPCLSGRAVAYRTEILQDPDFTYEFTHETWGVDHFLNADDDNFITRWLFWKNWKIKFQYHKECEVETTLENNRKYLNQCLRWVRSNWRSNRTSLFETGDVWIKYPWSTYAVFQTTITQWASAYDFTLFYAFYQASAEVGYPLNSLQWWSVVAWSIFVGHWLFSKSIKLVPHFFRNPQDLRYLPVSILFGYFHNFIKLWGLLTLHETTWGTREGADTDDNIRMLPIDPSTKCPLGKPLEKRRVVRERGALLPIAAV